VHHDRRDRAFRVLRVDYTTTPPGLGYVPGALIRSLSFRQSIGRDRDPCRDALGNLSRRDALCCCPRFCLRRSRSRRSRLPRRPMLALAIAYAAIFLCAPRVLTAARSTADAAKYS